MKEKLSNIYYTLYRFFREVKHFPRNLIEYIRNIKTYSKFLWNDYEWNGEESFYKFLEIKLNKLEKFYSNQNDVWQTEEGRLEILKQVRYAKDLLNILIDESSFFSKEERNFMDEYMFEMKNYTENSGKRKEYSRLLEMQREVIDQTHIDLFNYLGKHIKEWWD